MYVTALILIFLASLQGCVSLSLVEKGKHRLVLLFIGALCGMVMSSFAVNFTLNDVTKVFNTSATLQTICSIQIIEALGGIFFTLQYSRSLLYGSAGWRALSGRLSFAPPLMLIAGLFFVQIITVSRVNGHSYFLLLVTVTVLLTALLYFLARCLRWVFRSSGVLLELKLVMYFLQIITAMFIPVAVFGEPPVGTGQCIDMKATIIAASVIVFIVITGFLISQFRKEGI